MSLGGQRGNPRQEPFSHPPVLGPGGFPATWQDALKEANAQPVGMPQWIHLPGESWAEAFSVAMVGGGREKTLDYGRTINPVAMKAWFVSLMPAAP